MSLPGRAYRCLAQVPKIRGLTSGTASGGESEPASGEPSPSGQLVARAGSISGALGAAGGGGGLELPLAHAGSRGSSAGIGGSPHSPHTQYRSRLSGSGVPGAPGVLGSMHLVPGPPQASSPSMRYSTAGAGPGAAGVHLPRVHAAASAGGLDNAFLYHGLHVPQTSFSSQSLGGSKQHHAQLHGAPGKRSLGGGDGPSTAPGSPSAGLPRLRVSASGVHDSPLRQRLTNAGLMDTGTPGTASPVARYSSTGVAPHPSGGGGGAPAAALLAAALGLTGGAGGAGGGSGVASRAHSFSTPGLPPHLMPQQLGSPVTGGSSHLPAPVSPLRMLGSVGSGGAAAGGGVGVAGGSGSVPCSPSDRGAPRAHASPLCAADALGHRAQAAAGADGARFPAVTSASSCSSSPPLAPQPPAGAATSSGKAVTAGACDAAAKEATAAKGAAAAAEAAAWISQLDGGRRSDSGLLWRTAVVAPAAATSTRGAGRGTPHGGAAELAAALAVLRGSGGGSGAARKG